MPRRRALLAVLFLVAGAPSAAGALYSVAFAFEGDVTTVNDPDGRLDGSVAPGTRLKGRYEVDPLPTGLPGEVSGAHLSFEVGSYRFDVYQAPHTITLQDDLPVGAAQVDRWSPAAFVADQLDPAIPAQPDLVGYSAQIEFIDFSHTLLTGAETQPYLVFDAAPWSTKRLIFSALVAAPGGGAPALDYPQWAVALDSWSVVPEPASGVLLALGLALLARARHPVP